MHFYHIILLTNLNLICSIRKKLLRTVDLQLLSAKGSKTVNFVMTADKQMRMLAIKIPREYDLVGATSKIHV